MNTVECPHCHGEYTIRDDGTLRSHGYDQFHPLTSRRCPGSRQKVVCECVYRSKKSADKGIPDEVHAQCLTHGLGDPY